ncbi:regulatory-associated protein of TOR [Trifolium repens]|nr:regulatory-associated protein of TOR [Trifolium repens]KAK2453092.1 regulatory-associated protein of TOR [Trifolium repens]
MIFKDRNFLICHHRLKNRIHLHAPTFTITVMQNLRFVGLCFKSQGSVASSTFGWCSYLCFMENRPHSNNNKRQMKGLTGADARKGTSYGGCQSTRGTFYGRIDALGTMGVKNDQIKRESQGLTEADAYYADNDSEDEGMQATPQLHVGWFAAGFIDGSVRLYDARTPEMAGLELVLDLVCTALGNKFTLHSEEHLLGSRRR